jgi:hypothetical protein
VVAVFLLFSSCALFDSGDIFPAEYYTTNFISAIGFDQFVGNTPGAPADPLTAEWDMAYRYDSWDNYNYMTLVDTTQTASFYGSVPTGLAGTAPVYQLNLVNLIDAGDFEADDGGTWNPTGSATPTYPAVSATISGLVSMQIRLETASKMVFTPAYVPALTIINGKNYNMFFKYKASSSFLASSINGSYVDFNNAVLPNEMNLVISGDSGSVTCIFEPPNTDAYDGTIVVDDFRLTQQSSGNYLRLLLLPEETSLQMLNGDYSFSVWVHSDPDSYENQSPYHLDSFKLTMKSTTGSNQHSLVPKPYIYTNSGSTGWVKLTAYTSSNALQIDPDRLPTDPVLELVIDCTASRPGTVLLAQPELRFHPDGY